MKLIDQNLLDELTGGARISERKRKNLNFHFDDADLLQRMLNAFEPDTYVRPHQHGNPPKREVFLILRGRLLILFFNDAGKVTKRVILSSDSGNLGIEIPPGIWHMAISLEEGTIVYELKDGPYNPVNDKQFASWAPEEGTPEAIVYLEKLKTENMG
jgi:cupin fold WbuC family metalloprotein